tara:strand:+ start:322 stop:546 length:225 start_codon:yes stop_codon:yes gene_type:complete
MDNKLIKLNKLLDKKKEKYPNITSVWKNYINIKKNSLEKDLENGINLFNKIENLQHEDLDLLTIAFIYLISKKL